MCLSTIRCYIAWRKFLLLFFLCQFALLIQCGDAGKISSSTTPPTVRKIDPKLQPGKVRQTFNSSESSWVPGVSAAVIVIIVFLISIFACCIHCPFCIVYKRNSNHRIV